MTEEEAKTHDCIGPDSCGTGGEGQRRCIGSKCGMGWRRSSPKYRDSRLLVTHQEWFDALAHNHYEPVLTAIKEAEAAGWVPAKNDTRLFGWSLHIYRGEIPSGYCGLATKP